MFLDTEGITSLGKLIDWHLLKGKVSYRNLKGYSVHAMVDNQRESTPISDRKALIKVGDLKRAIIDFLTHNSSNVKLELECFDEQIGFRMVQEQRLPTIKYATKEGNQEEILAQLIVDCERKSFVLRSLLSNFNSSLSVSQSPSNYGYIKLNIPFDVLNPLMSNEEVHIFQSDDVVLMAVPTFDENTFTSSLFFKTPDFETQVTLLSKFFNQEFPSTFPLIGEFISNQIANQRAELVYNYKVGSPSVGNILFIDSSEVPFFGDHKLQNCFTFLQLVRDDIAKYGVVKADTQLLKTTLSLNQQEEDVEFIVNKLNKFRDDKTNFLKSKKSVFKFCWEVAKTPFVSVGNHLLEVFGFRKSELSIGQKWMFRIAYVITAYVIKEKIVNYMEERSFCLSLEEKVGSSNRLFSDLLRSGVCSDWNSQACKKIIWKSKEVLTLDQIDAIVGMFKYSFDKKDFISLLLSTGNIQKLYLADVKHLFGRMNLLSSEKLDFLDRMKPHLILKSNKEVQTLVEEFLSYERDKASKILEGIVKP